MELEHTQNLHVVITVSMSVLYKEFCYLCVDWQWKNIHFLWCCTSACAGEG